MNICSLVPLLCTLQSASFIQKGGVASSGYSNPQNGRSHPDSAICHFKHKYCIFIKKPLETITFTQMQSDDCSTVDLVDLDRVGIFHPIPELPKIQQITAFHSEIGSSLSNISHSGSSNSSSPYSEVLCSGCGYEIKDRYIMKVMNESYHENCLRCVACSQNLSTNSTCFTKDGHVYCREDHSILFGRRCGRCRGSLQPTDIDFRGAHAAYHTSCFTCYHCNTPFSTGDECLVKDGEIFCRHDYHLLMQQLHAASMPGLAFDMDHMDSKKTPKRPRTILNAQQRRQFKAAFEKSAKPCRKVREQLAKETGLSVRVVQVWFQNQRAKVKKTQRKEDNKKTDGKSSEDPGKSSDEEIDSDVDEVDDQENSCKEMTELINPIEKLNHMQYTYFQCT